MLCIKPARASAEEPSAVVHAGEMPYPPNLNRDRLVPVTVWLGGTCLTGFQAAATSIHSTSATFKEDPTTTAGRLSKALCLCLVPTGTWDTTLFSHLLARKSPSQ